MRVARVTAALGVLIACSSPASADVRLTIHDGHVTLSARDATIPQILAEWARVGQTKIVNGERVSGPPVTLEMSNVPEEEALKVILRSVSGYVAAPRSVSVGVGSRYDRILVMPTSSPAQPATSAAALQVQQQPRAIQPPPMIEDDQPTGLVQPNMPPGDPRAPGFVPMPQPGGVAQPGGLPQPMPAATPAPSSYRTPTSPVGVPVPGMIVQPPPAQPQAYPPGFVPPANPALPPGSIPTAPPTAPGVGPAAIPPGAR